MNQISRSVDSDFTVLNRRGTPHGPIRRLLRHLRAGEVIGFSGDG
jgi:hypothetical protein